MIIRVPMKRIDTHTGVLTAIHTMDIPVAAHLPAFLALEAGPSGDGDIPPDEAVVDAEPGTGEVAIQA